MKEIACLGSEAFTLGFRLTGIRRCITLKDTADLLVQAAALRDEKTAGIVIVEESALAQLDGPDREDIEDSVDPVFIPLATETAGDNLRKLIIKSIGVDLWKEEA